MQTSEISTGWSGSAASSPAKGASGTITADFETFLKLLTTQLQNQDPLNPIDSSDYAVQIATFSGVEQQVLTNELLADMVGGMGDTGLAAYGDWVGQQVRAAAPAQFDGTPVSVLPPVAAGADSAVLVVTDATGSEVQRIAIATDGAALDWAGVDDTGQPLPAGLYGFAVESYDQDILIGTAQAQTYGTVQEVVLGPNGVTLTLAGGVEVPADGVSALRAP